MAEHRMRNVRLLEAQHVLGAHVELGRGKRVLEVLELRRPDDRCRHAGAVQQPRERELRRRHAALGRDLRDAVGDVEVLGPAVERVGELVGLRSRRAPLAGSRARPRQEAPRERAPRDDPDALVEAQRDHLALLLAVDEVVVVLHRHEPRPPVARGDVLRLRELPREHAARSDVARLARADDVVQRLHRLLDRRVRVPAVDLVEVDVVHAEPLQRGVDGGEDVLAREPAPVRARRHLPVHLGRDHRLVARQEARHEPARGHLARAARVDVGGVEERDAALDGAADDRLRGGLVEDPGAVGVVAVAHHPEAHARDVEAGAAESDLIHRESLPQAAVRRARAGERKDTVPRPQWGGVAPPRRNHVIRRSFNAGWTAGPGLTAFASIAGASGTDRRAVTLPYDVVRDLPRSPDAADGAATGYFPDGFFEYAKTFDVPEDHRERTVLVEFEGVYRDAVVSINGDFAGQRPSGYTNFSVKADPYLRYGEPNTIRVQARAHRDSRWYTGAGIHRDTKIVVGGLVHVALDGVRITTPDVDAERAVVSVAATVENEARATRTVRVTTRILDANGQAAASGSAMVTLLPRTSELARLRLYVPAPRLWSVDAPELYIAETTVTEDDTVLDEERTRFGIRTLQLDP